MLRQISQLLLNQCLENTCEGLLHGCISSLDAWVPAFFCGAGVHPVQGVLKKLIQRWHVIVHYILRLSVSFFMSILNIVIRGRLYKTLNHFFNHYFVVK
jgi:hypothetical protein